MILKVLSHFQLNNAKIMNFNIFSFSCSRYKNLHRLRQRRYPSGVVTPIIITMVTKLIKTDYSHTCTKLLAWKCTVVNDFI